MKFDIIKCSACGQDHPQQLVRALSGNDPMKKEGFEYWFFCRVGNKPVFIKQEEDK
jgi:hypothetical protein